MLGIALLMPVMMSEDNAEQLAYEALELKEARHGVLKTFGERTTPVLEDMRSLHHHIAASLKEAGAAPSDYCISNKALSSFLVGNNPIKQEYLPKDHRARSAEDLLVDRWGSPIGVRVEPDGVSFALHSYGKDRQASTSDDLIYPLEARPKRLPRPIPGRARDARGAAQ